MKSGLEENFDETRDILEQGKHKLENPNFEETLMDNLVTKKRSAVEVGNTIRYSLISFAFGLFLCIALIFIFLFNINLKLGTPTQVLCFASLFVLGVMGILIIENYLKLLGNYPTQN